MGFDTQTYWLTDRQSQCDFDFMEGGGKEPDAYTKRDSKKKVPGE
jgi:hypothetical protein